MAPRRGASFCYGDLSFEPDEEDDEVRDELGGEGLCVRIRTHVFMFLEIAYNRTVLGRVNLTDPGARAARSSRSSSTAPPAAAPSPCMTPTRARGR